MHTRLITENLLDNWVRGKAEIAKGVIVELVDRLVSASSPNPTDKRFPLGDSINQSGLNIGNTDLSAPWLNPLR